MPLAARRFFLTAHIITSVGLLGASAAVLVLAALAATAADAATTHAAFVGLQALTGTIVPPLAVTGAATGVVLAVRGRWGLLVHWWVVIKIVLTAAVIAQGALVVRPLVAREVSPGWVVGAAAAGQAMLVVATVLSVYKPGGRVRRRASASPPPTPSS
jgi:hypothetical protein